MALGEASTPRVRLFFANGAMLRKMAKQGLVSASLRCTPVEAVMESGSQKLRGERRR